MLATTTVKYGCKGHALRQGSGLDSRTMVRVRINKICRGGNKVAGTKLFRGELGLGLKSAKAITDEVMDGNRPVIEVASQEQAQTLVEQLALIGFEAEVDKG